MLCSRQAGYTDRLDTTVQSIHNGSLIQCKTIDKYS